MLVLLATGGYLVYAGPTKNAIDYFQRHLKLVFPQMANPADVFMDAITLDSAKALCAQDNMKIADDDVAFQDRDAFGIALAGAWTRAAAAYEPKAADVVALLPNLAQERASWGEALLAQTKRAMLQTKLDASSSLAICIVLMFGVALLGVVMDATGDQPQKCMVQSVVALFYLCLTQGVAAQRVFGGGERVVAWREAGVEVNMILYFVGRDLSSLVDIVLYTTVFTGCFWPLSPLQMSFHNMFWGSFACIYAIWGLNFIFSVMVEPATANMIAVVLAFICQMFGGIEPPFKDLVHLGGDGQLGDSLIALSPLRWTLDWFLYKEFTSEATPFKNPIHHAVMGGFLAQRGFGADVTTTNSKPVAELWREDPPNSFVKGTVQIYMLGFLYRFIALVVSLRMAKKHAKGGGSAMEAGDGDSKKDETSVMHVIKGMFVAFVVVFVRMEVQVILNCQ
eukprot:TRINITY_DN5003_c0_g1_i5.p1 TRINITY_DN5003_c0_g1~~TRINITY_DN5003_c0_g1_i5.p1  ORF type:complete len:451 (-),score=89.55 TRINITY_DN5003_c0_g1_i5:235-1587(-)